jgi:hypothetical protein
MSDEIHANRSRSSSKSVRCGRTEPWDWRDQIVQNLNRRGFTLIEIMVITLLIGFVLYGRHVGRQMIGGPWAGLIGGVLGFAAFLLLAATIILLLDLASVGIPDRPRCRRGCCRAKDYELTVREEQSVLVCRCGDIYKRRGRQFMVIVDGHEVPYMKWRSFRGWYPEEADTGSKSDR